MGKTSIGIDARQDLIETAGDSPTKQNIAKPVVGFIAGQAVGARISSPAVP